MEPRKWLESGAFGGQQDVVWKVARNGDEARDRGVAIVCHEFTRTVDNALHRRNNMSRTELAGLAGVNVETLHRRMRGESPFQLREMVAVIGAVDWDDLTAFPQLRDDLQLD